MAEVGDIPEEVFHMAAIAVDPVDPDGTQRNQSFRQAVAAGWIQGRASIPDDEEAEPAYAHDAHCNTFHEAGPEGCPPARLTLDSERCPLPHASRADIMIAVWEHDDGDEHGPRRGIELTHACGWNTSYTHDYPVTALDVLSAVERHLPPAESPDHDSVYLDIRDGLLTVTQTTGRTLSVMVNGAYIAVPDRTRSTINYGLRSSIEYGSRGEAGDG